MKAILRFGIAVVAAALVGASAFFIIQFKAHVDQSAGLCVLAEKALRTGNLRPDELTFTPFGFGGWHLFPYYIAHDGKASDAIADFGLYFRGYDVQVNSNYSRSLRKFSQFNRVAPSDKRDVFGFHHMRFLWLYDAEYYLLRIKSPTAFRPRASLGTDFEEFDTLFPLNEVEWKTLITANK